MGALVSLMMRLWELKKLKELIRELDSKKGLPKKEIRAS